MHLTLMTLNKSSTTENVLKVIPSKIMMKQLKSIPESYNTATFPAGSMPASAAQYLLKTAHL